MKVAALFLVSVGSVLALPVSAQDVSLLEIKFCPAGQVRTFPLESSRGVQSLLLQNLAVLNSGAAVVEVTELTFELLRDANPVDVRRFAGAELASITASGPVMQKSGMLKMLAFQFCGSALISEGVALAGTSLAPKQAFLITSQPFAFKGKRDAVRVRVRARVDSREIEAAATIPIQSASAKTPMKFPLRGVWFAMVGPTMHTGHRWALPEEFGYDIVRLGPGGLSHRGTGARFSDYYAYGADVLAAGDGRVVAATNDQPENAAALRRPDETLEAYGVRVQEIQLSLLAKGTKAVTGNYVVIDHENGEFSFYAHLQPGSVTVRVGERISARARLGKLGSSGNSTEPHLHFQVCDAADPLMCAGIPVVFQNIELPYADYPRPLQSGDAVIAE
jgi:murein DD-endopeptidase MepM/ murein hydrolase activator NlpD